MKFINTYKDDVRNEVTISITGYIGEDFRGGDLINYLRTWHDNTERVNLDLFSFGGSAFDAIAVYEFLTTSGFNDVVANIYGFCGSAATIIACAAKTVNIGQHSFFFVHNAYDGYSGEQNENTAKVSEQIAAIYKKKTGLDLRVIRKLMNEGDQGALLGAKEALEYGFVDKIIKEKMSMAAAFKQRFADGEAATPLSNPNRTTMEFRLIEWVRSMFNADVKDEAEAQKFLQEKAPEIIKASAGQGEAANKQQERIDALEAKLTRLEATVGEAAKQAQLTTLQGDVTSLLEQVAALAEATKEAKQSTEEATTTVQVQESAFQAKVRELAETIAALKAAPAAPPAAQTTPQNVPAVAAQVQAALQTGTVVRSTAADAVLAQILGKQPVKN